MDAQFLIDQIKKYKFIDIRGLDIPPSVVEEVVDNGYTCSRMTVTKPGSEEELRLYVLAHPRATQRSIWENRDKIHRVGGVV